MKILCAHGVNLDLLGTREPHIYGHLTLKMINQELMTAAKSFFNSTKLDLVFSQTNDEREYLELFSQSDANGFLINPGAWSHTSLALADRLVGIGKPYVEVHLSNLSAREDFRHKSFAAPHAAGVVYGAGVDSYVAGLLILVRRLNSI